MLDHRRTRSSRDDQRSLGLRNPDLPAAARNPYIAIRLPGDSKRATHDI